MTNSAGIVIASLGFDFLLRIGQRRKLLHALTCISQKADERLDLSVTCGRAEPRDVPLHSVLPGPVLQGQVCEFRAVIHRDRTQQRGPQSQTIFGLSDVPAPNREAQTQQGLSRLH